MTPDRKKLTDLLRQGRAKMEGMPPAEREAMMQAQRASWVRGMTTPCEHGVVDFEQCPDCRRLALKGQYHE